MPILSEYTSFLQSEIVKRRRKDMLTFRQYIVYSGKRKLFLDKNEKEFTQMITFSVSDNEDSSNIVQFIIAVSEVNPLYAVRILK